jgi:hypothetical protein
MSQKVVSHFPRPSQISTYWLVFGVVCSILISLLLPSLRLIVVSAEIGNVVISEINYQGSIRPDCPRCPWDKWIELYNPTTQTQNIGEWLIRFRNSEAKYDNIQIPSGAVIKPQGFYLIGEKETDLQSTLQLVGISPDFTAAPMQNISNNSLKKIEADLLNKSKQSVHKVKVEPDTLIALESSNQPYQKRSLETYPKLKLSDNEYYPNNFATPRFLSVVSQKPPTVSTPQPAAQDNGQANQTIPTISQPVKNPSPQPNSRLSPAFTPDPIPNPSTSLSNQPASNLTFISNPIFDLTEESLSPNPSPLLKNLDRSASLNLLEQTKEANHNLKSRLASTAHSTETSNFISTLNHQPINPEATNSFSLADPDFVSQNFIHPLVQNLRFDNLDPDQTQLIAALPFMVLCLSLILVAFLGWCIWLTKQQEEREAEQTYHLPSGEIKFNQI